MKPPPNLAINWLGFFWGGGFFPCSNCLRKKKCKDESRVKRSQSHVVHKTGSSRLKVKDKV